VCVCVWTEKQAKEGQLMIIYTSAKKADDFFAYDKMEKNGIFVAKTRILSE